MIWVWELFNFGHRDLEINFSKWFDLDRGYDFGPSLELPKPSSKPTNITTVGLQFYTNHISLLVYLWFVCICVEFMVSIMSLVACGRKISDVDFKGNELFGSDLRWVRWVLSLGGAWNFGWYWGTCGGCESHLWFCVVFEL